MSSSARRGSQQAPRSAHSKPSAQNPSAQNPSAKSPAEQGKHAVSRSGGRRGPGQRGFVGRGFVGRGIFSAIDLGTNNCRLLIARPTRSGFRVIDAFSRIVRLGEGVSESGMLSEAAMDRTIDALRICAKKVERRRVTCMRHVATEACRVAGNSADFVQRVRDEAGINLEIISAAEEARLAVVGCQSLISKSSRHALVFDIGGGSTELIWLRVRQDRSVEIKGWMSVPWGVVNLTETYSHDNADFVPGAYDRMKAEVHRHIAPFETQYGLRDCISAGNVQFLGTSGTVTTLASLQMELPQYSRDQVDGAWMPSADMVSLSQELAAMTFETRAALPCIGQDRARLVVAGCAILEAMLDLWPVQTLRVADRGIREGILRGLMENDLPVSVNIEKSRAAREPIMESH